MPVTAVIGAQWGDEGKGKIVDYLAQRADVVARGNGGDNAGHTVVNERGEFKLHLIPAGIFNPQTLCLIGNGVVVNPENLAIEMNSLRQAGVNLERLKISNLANLIMPWHNLLDKLEEESRGQEVIGTTQKGIGPCYSDKAARKGIRVGDLFLLDDKDFQRRLYLIWREKTEILEKIYHNTELGSFEQILHKLWYYRTILEPYIAGTEQLIWQAIAKDKYILLEGAQATGLDIDFGTYPNVTSSACTVAGVCHGLGIPPQRVNEVIGVVKAYPTRVGSKKQPFPTEIPDDLAHILREHAQEYGATTGRPRRIGWLDIVQLKYAVQINGFTSLAVTRLDSLGILPKVKICCSYRKDGSAVFAVIPSWGSELGNCRSFADLPVNARIYSNIVERLVGVPIKLISVGPERNQIIVKE